MAHHILEFDEECKSCGGTGLYAGIDERDGAAVVCHNCKGTGRHHVKIEYDDFVGRKPPTVTIERVYQVNPGIVIGIGKGKYKLSDFGGITFEDWDSGKPFPIGSENRNFTCPCWWYQSADYTKKPKWEECGWGSFSSCEYFPDKHKCWERWDSEYK